MHERRPRSSSNSPSSGLGSVIIGDRPAWRHQQHPLSPRLGAQVKHLPSRLASHDGSTWQDQISCRTADDRSQGFPQTSPRHPINVPCVSSIRFSPTYPGNHGVGPLTWTLAMARMVTRKMYHQGTSQRYPAPGKRRRSPSHSMARE